MVVSSKRSIIIVNFDVLLLPPPATMPRQNAKQIHSVFVKQAQRYPPFPPFPRIVAVSVAVSVAVTVVVTVVVSVVGWHESQRSRTGVTILLMHHVGSVILMIGIVEIKRKFKQRCNKRRRRW